MQEITVLDWARWARTQVAEWRSTTDPGHWDPLRDQADTAATIRRALAGEGVVAATPSDAGAPLR